MNGNEGERLARIEEQIHGMREDVSEMKSSVKTAADIMSQMHVNFVPRTEIEKQIQLREKAEEEQNRQLLALWKQVDKSKQWQSRIGGALALLSFFFTAAVALVSIVINKIWR